MQLNMLLLLSAAWGLLAFGLVAVVLTGSVEELGGSVPHASALADYAIGLAWALFLSLCILAWPVPQKDKVDLLILWVAKIWVALVVMLFYEAQYPFLDAYSYYAVPKTNDFVWDSFKIMEGTENIYRLVWLHDALGPNSYHALKLSFAMVGLVAIYTFYRGIVLYLGRSDRRILYAIGLFPSVLFWSSIVGKDPVVMLGIALYAYGAVASWKYGRWFLWPLLSGIVVVCFVRVWLVPILVVALLPLLVSRRWPPIKRIVAFTVIAVAAVATVLLLSRLISAEGEQLLDAVDRISRAWSQDGGSGQVVQADLSEVRELLAFIPLGTFTAFFRPLPGEVPNAFGLLAGLESTVLLGLFALAALRCRVSDFRDPVVVWAIMLVAGWAVIYGFLSYQNLGTGARFRVQILPVFLCLLLYLAQKQRVLAFRVSLRS